MVLNPNWVNEKHFLKGVFQELQTVHRFRRFDWWKYENVRSIQNKKPPKQFLLGG
jgi:hypothetical protein